MLGTRKKPSNRAQTKPPSSSVTVPEQLHRVNFDQDTEPEALAECVVPHWRERVAKSGAVNSKSVAVSPQPTDIVLKYAEVEYSSGILRTKADLMAREHEEPAPWYSRNDISILDRSLPLNLSTPKLEGSWMQASSGTSSRKTTDYSVESTNYHSPTVLFLAAGTKETWSPAVGEMCSWNTSKTVANTKLQLSGPKREAADISSARKALLKEDLSSGSQWESIPDEQVVAPPAILHRNISLVSVESVLKNTPVFSFGANLEPHIQISEHADPRKKVQKVTKIPNRSDLHISLASSMRGSGYSFTKNPQFSVVNMVGSFEQKILEPAILEPSSVTSNPKIRSLKRIPSWRKGCEGNSDVRAIASSIQAEIISPQKPSLQRTDNTFTQEVNPVVKLAEIKSDKNAKTQDISSLPGAVEETDFSRSSSDEEGGEQVKEVPPFEDVTLISSNPWVKRITARRRMRQGEFSKW